MEHSESQSASLNWPRNALLLLLATLAAQLAYPTYLALAKGYEMTGMLINSIIFLLVLTLPSLWVGFKLGRTLGIGLINSHQKSVPSLAKGLVFAGCTAVLLGALLLFLRWLLQPHLPAELPEYGFRGPIGGLLVSIGAAVGEEIWFRFGLMTLVLFVAQKISRNGMLSNPMVYGIIVLIGLLFGLAHLPQLLSYNAGTTFAIFATIGGNVAVSILYGWCFWRFGLLSAICAHFALDIVLHVFPAFF